MNYLGLFIGFSAFVIIGAFHPLIIWIEYYGGTGYWWAFLVAGLVALAASLLSGGPVISALLGVFGFTCLWSIKELFEQEQRVKKGWFPKNPRRKT